MTSDPSNDRSIPIVFFITTVAAYGLLLTQTGFYWDDWPFAWIAHFLGPQEFIPAFDGVRPFLGPIFLATTGLIPPVPVYWQIFALFIRFSAVLAAWFMLRQVWPQHRQQVLAASLLFLLFPGYSQHWVALTHINQEWVSLICYLLSFGLTVYALRNPSRFQMSTLAALVFLLPGVFPTEYFATIEPLRLIFIWAVVQDAIQGWRNQFIRTLKLWLPYMIIWLANAAWLLYFYTLGNYDSYDVDVVQEPLSVYGILSTMADALWKMGVYIWGHVILLTGASITSPSSLLAIALIGAAFIFFVFYLSRVYSETAPSRIFSLTAMIAGIAGILLGRLPSFAAGLPLTLQSSWDRFGISMMLGGSLFIVGVVDFFLRGSRARSYVFALLIALSVGQQFFNANIFRRDWAKQQEIYWQLAWRIPAMQPGTAILTDQLPIDYETDLSFTAPLNWMYAPDYTHGDLPYALFYTEKRLGRTAIASLEPGMDLSMGMRSESFYGSTSQAIVIHMPPNGCLRVLDPALGDENTYARESRYLLDAIPLSRPDLIAVDSTQTPQLPFLREPEHTWCYYFAKAELARQKGNWAQVTELFRQANSQGYKPGDAFEWLVFIEAHAMTGEYEQAYTLADDALADDPKVRRGLCQVWKRVQSNGPARGDSLQQIADVLQKLDCPP